MRTFIKGLSHIGLGIVVSLTIIGSVFLTILPYLLWLLILFLVALGLWKLVFFIL